MTIRMKSTGIRGEHYGQLSIRLACTSNHGNPAGRSCWVTGTRPQEGGEQMSHALTATVSVAMTVAFFYGMFNAGLFLAMVLLVLLLRYAPQSMYTDTKKDADGDDIDAQETN